MCERVRQKLGHTRVFPSQCLTQFVESKTDVWAVKRLPGVLGSSTPERRLYGSYKWIIMLEKCGHPDLNVFFTSNV